MSLIGLVEMMDPYECSVMLWLGDDVHFVHIIYLRIHYHKMNTI